MKDLLVSLLAVILVVLIKAAGLEIALEHIFNIEVNIVWTALLVIIFDGSK